MHHLVRRARRHLTNLTVKIRAAIDLASIMVGVIVVAIVTGTVATSVFAVIPWSQDEAAKQSLAAVVQAQKVARTMDDERRYQTVGQMDGKYLNSADTLTVVTGQDGLCYVGASRSTTGKTFYLTSQDPTPKLYEGGVTNTDWCAPFDELLSELPAITVPMPGRGVIVGEIVARANDLASGWGQPLTNDSFMLGFGGLQYTHDQHPEETAPWSKTAPTTIPADRNTFSIGYDDNGANTGFVADTWGPRAAVVTVDNGKYVGAVQKVGGTKVICALEATSIKTAAALLAAVGADMLCPGITPSAITSAWAWGWSVDPADDPRAAVRYIPAMTPDFVAREAANKKLTSVFVSVPWAADNAAPLRDWIQSTVTKLHANGIKVYALGGENDWVNTPSLAATWTTSAFNTAPFDGIQFDVEPWNLPGQPAASVYAPKLVTMFDAAKAVAGGKPVNTDVPSWLANPAVAPVGGQTALDLILPHVDSVAIATFFDHATGADGIVQNAASAVAKASAAGKPFTIGVETENVADPSFPGGSLPAWITFHEEGRQVLNQETKKVRSAYGSTPGYQGVTVEHLYSWKTLKG